MSGIPDSAILELTFNCNHSCLFCYAPWLEEPSLYGRELSIPEWIEVAELLIRRGVRRFTLSGGELLLKEGVTKLIDFLAAHPERPHFTLYTNGSLVTRELVERLRGTRGDFAFSLPGIRCYRALTGSTWSVDGLIDLFDLCRNRGVPFGVGIVVTRPALREWKQLISLAVLSGAATVQIGPLSGRRARAVPSGAAADLPGGGPTRGGGAALLPQMPGSAAVRGGAFLLLPQRCSLHQAAGGAGRLSARSMFGRRTVSGGGAGREVPPLPPSAGGGRRCPPVRRYGKLMKTLAPRLDICFSRVYIPLYISGRFDPYSYGSGYAA